MSKTATRKLADITDEELPGVLLEGASERSRRSYLEDLKDFMRFMKAPSPGRALRRFLSETQQGANDLTRQYRSEMEDRRLAPSTIARRLTAVYRCNERAWELSLTKNLLIKDRPRVHTIQSIRRPTPDELKKLIAAAERQPCSGKGVDNGPAVMRQARDAAWIRLMSDIGPWPNEVVALDLADVDLQRGAVRVRGEWPSVKPSTSAALARWIELRGEDRGPLFTRQRNGQGSLARLSVATLNDVVTRLCERAGIRTEICAQSLREFAVDDAGRRDDPRALRRLLRSRARGREEPRRMKSYEVAPGPPDVADADDESGIPPDVQAAIDALSDKQRMTLSAVYDSMPEGITGPALIAATGLTDAPGIFRRLSLKPIWKDYLRPARGTHGKMRLDFPFNWEY